jgi:hypothetical protein
MPKFEQLLTDSLAGFAASNEALEEARDRKRKAASNIRTLLSEKHRTLPLKGFAVRKAIDSPNWGTNYVSLSGDHYEGASSDDEAVEGEWIAPDMYHIGGDRFGGSPAGSTVWLGVLPRSIYDAKRLEVVMSTLSVATAEEIAPAVTLRATNDAAFNEMWQEYKERVYLPAMQLETQAQIRG